jgi:hypothetical protein
MKLTDYGWWWKISIKRKGKWRNDIYLKNLDLSEIKKYDIFKKTYVFVVSIQYMGSLIYASKLANSYDLRFFWHESLPIRINSYEELAKRFLFSLKSCFSKNKGELSRREIFSYLRDHLSWRMD